MHIGVCLGKAYRVRFTGNDLQVLHGPPGRKDRCGRVDGQRRCRGDQDHGQVNDAAQNAQGQYG